MTIFNLTNTILSGTSDISCGAYNSIINQRLLAIQRDISGKKIGPPAGQPIRPIPFTNNNADTSTRNTAGATFNLDFPSMCQFCQDISNSRCGVCHDAYGKEKDSCYICLLYNKLLKKKGYMFTNSNNKNVISGPIKWRSENGIITVLQFGGTSGSGLTKNQQLSNVGKGLTPDGKPAKKFGVQSYDGIRLYSNSNIYSNVNPTNITNGANSINPTIGFIPLCSTISNTYPIMGPYFNNSNKIIKSISTVGNSYTSGLIYNQRFTIDNNNTLYIIRYNSTSKQYEIRSNNLYTQSTLLFCWRLIYAGTSAIQSVQIINGYVYFTQPSSPSWCGNLYIVRTTSYAEPIALSHPVCRLNKFRTLNGVGEGLVVRWGGVFYYYTMKNDGSVDDSASPITLTDSNHTNFANNSNYYFITNRFAYNIYFIINHKNPKETNPQNFVEWRTMASPQANVNNNSEILNVMQVECSERYLYALCSINNGTIYRWDLSIRPLEGNSSDPSNWKLFATQVNINEPGLDISNNGSWSYRSLIVLDMNDDVFIENQTRVVKVDETTMTSLSIPYPSGTLILNANLLEYYDNSNNIIPYDPSYYINQPRFTFTPLTVFAIIYNKGVNVNKYQLRSCNLDNTTLTNSRDVSSNWTLFTSFNYPINSIIVGNNDNIYYTKAQPPSSDGYQFGDLYLKYPTGQNPNEEEIAQDVYRTVLFRNYTGGAHDYISYRKTSGSGNFTIHGVGGDYANFVSAVHFTNNRTHIFAVQDDGSEPLPKICMRGYTMTNSGTKFNLNDGGWTDISGPTLSDISSSFVKQPLTVIQTEASTTYLYALCYELFGVIFRAPVPKDSSNPVWQGWRYNVNNGQFGQIRTDISKYRPLMVRKRHINTQVGIETDNIFMEQYSFNTSQYNIVNFGSSSSQTQMMASSDYLGPYSDINSNVLPGDDHKIYNARFTITGGVIYALIYDATADQPYKIKSCKVENIQQAMAEWVLEFSSAYAINSIYVIENTDGDYELYYTSFGEYTPNLDNAGGYIYKVVTSNSSYLITQKLERLNLSGLVWSEAPEYYTIYTKRLFIPSCCSPPPRAIGTGEVLVCDPTDCGPDSYCAIANSAQIANSYVEGTVAAIIYNKLWQRDNLLITLEDQGLSYPYGSIVTADAAYTVVPPPSPSTPMAAITNRDSTTFPLNNSYMYQGVPQEPFNPLISITNSEKITSYVTNCTYFFASLYGGSQFMYSYNKYGIFIQSTTASPWQKYNVNDANGDPLTIVQVECDPGNLYLLCAENFGSIYTIPLPSNTIAGQNTIDSQAESSSLDQNMINKTIKLLARCVNAGEYGTTLTYDSNGTLNTDVYRPLMVLDKSTYSATGFRSDIYVENNNMIIKVYSATENT